MIWLKQVLFPQAMLVWGGKITLLMGRLQWLCSSGKKRGKKEHADKMFLFITCNKIRCKTQASF